MVNLTCLISECLKTPTETKESQVENATSKDSNIDTVYHSLLDSSTDRCTVSRTIRSSNLELIEVSIRSSVRRLGLV